jgi:hypothetical protein
VSEHGLHGIYQCAAILITGQAGARCDAIGPPLAITTDPAARSFQSNCGNASQWRSSGGVEGADIVRGLADAWDCSFGRNFKAHCRQERPEAGWPSVIGRHP